MSVLFLVRHGQASFQGESFGLLTELGRQQAQLLGDFFARTDRRFDACFHGTLPRQFATAEILNRCLCANGGQSPRVLPALNEHDTGAIIKEQLPELTRRDPSLKDALASAAPEREALRRVLEAALMRWATTEFVSPQIESWHQFTHRVRDALSDIAAAVGPQGKALVVTSGGPISVAMQWALDLAPAATMRLEWRVRNTSVSVFKVTAASAELLAFNSAAHLEGNKDTAMVTYL